MQEIIFPYSPSTELTNGEPVYLVIKAKNDEDEIKFSYTGSLRFLRKLSLDDFDTMMDDIEIKANEKFLETKQLQTI